MLMGEIPINFSQKESLEGDVCVSQGDSLHHGSTSTKKG